MLWQGAHPAGLSGMHYQPPLLQIAAEVAVVCFHEQLSRDCAQNFDATACVLLKPSTATGSILKTYILTHGWKGCHALDTS